MQTGSDLVAVTLPGDELFEDAVPINALLVEDDETWAHGMKRALQPYGISACIAENVQRARSFLLKPFEPIDIVLLNAGPMNGKSDLLLDEIEALPRQPGVVILSTLVEELGFEALSYRVNLVPKRIHPRELASIMRRVARGYARDTIERFAKRFRLTPKETEMLDAIAGGASPKQISISLGCSRQAVHALLARLNAKTDCASYQEVIAKLFQFSCQGLGHAK